MPKDNIDLGINIPAGLMADIQTLIKQYGQDMFVIGASIVLRENENILVEIGGKD